MGYRCEFDRENGILLLRIDGRLTEESVVEYYRAAQKYWTASDAKMGIIDYSTVTEICLSTEFVNRLASRGTVAADRPRIVVAPDALMYGLSRMFQAMSERARPALQVVHTLEEAYTALGVQSPKFEPLE
jgi:hypothetical protein